MIVQVVTQRPDEYAYLEKMYRQAAQFVFSDVLTMPPAGGPAPDIVLADPAAAAGRRMPALRRGSPSGRFIVCAPGRKRSLMKELRAAGLVPSGQGSLSDAAGAELPENMAADSGMEKSRPDYRYVIGVADMSPGAGAELLTLLLAEELASESYRDGSLVTVFAPDDPYYYNALSLGKRLGDGQFGDIASAAAEDGAAEPSGRRVFNMDEGISWAVASGPVSGGIGPRLRGKLLESAEGNYLLTGLPGADIGGEIDGMRGDLDVIVLCVDPLPSAMLRGVGVLETLQSCGIPVIYAVTRMNGGVDKNAVLDFLGTEDAVFVPFIDPARVYAAEFSGENPYRDDEVRREAMPAVCGITERIRKITGRTE